MKPLVTAIVICCFFCNSGKAQNTILLEVDSVFNGDKIQLPFKDITVADARFNKLSLGFVYGKVVLGIHTRKKQTVNFPDSLQNYLRRMIEHFSELSDTAREGLFILIKKFRVSEQAATSVKGTLNSYLTLNLSASFYRTTNHFYQKMFSVDDLFMDYVDPELDVKLSFQYLRHQRAQLLNKMLYKLLAYRNWGIHNNGPGFYDTEINTALQKRFMLPVYSQQAGVGLYKSFQEFKNAVPSVTGITIHYKGDKIDNLLDSNGNPVPMNEYWGVSNGKKNFLFFRKEFTELIPADKSFRIMSYVTADELNGRTPMSTTDEKTGLKGFFEGKRPSHLILTWIQANFFWKNCLGKPSFSTRMPTG